MPSRKNRPTRKRPVKRLLDELLPAKKAKIVTRQLDSDEDSAGESSNVVASCSSSVLKRYEEVKNNQGTSPDPTLLTVPSTTQVELSQQSVQVRLFFICNNLAQYF